MRAENTAYSLKRKPQAFSVDPIYLDPPFNSKQAYNVIFEEDNGTGSTAQIEAFDDAWHWTMDTIEGYQNVLEAGGGRAVPTRWPHTHCRWIRRGSIITESGAKVEVAGEARKMVVEGLADLVRAAITPRSERHKQVPAWHAGPEAHDAQGEGGGK